MRPHKYHGFIKATKKTYESESTKKIDSDVHTNIQDSRLLTGVKPTWQEHKKRIEAEIKALKKQGFTASEIRDKNLYELGL